MSLDLAPVLKSLDENLIGQRSVVEHSLACLIAGGHLLLEGPPGVGKTRLALSLSTTFGGLFHRVQMTSDLLPSDVIGYLRPNLKTQELEFRRGPVFANFLLIDELNRATPKTQSALLEAMAEHQVTVDGVRHALPAPFFVIATQNPVDSQGVFPLTESQLDRFSLLLEMDLPIGESEMQIYSKHLFAKSSIDTPKQSKFSLDQLGQFKKALGEITVEESVFKYLYHLVQSSRTHPEVCYGVSVRGALQYIDTVRALALVRGRRFVIPKDVHELAIPCMAHRLNLIRENASLTEKRVIVEEVLGQVTQPE